ncbi:MAG: FoF1 ATP synthase subunit gamma [Candidatus Omnitrophota bacterium]
MIPVAQLKSDVEFYKSLASLIEVLKLIAAAQYQILDKKIKNYSVYLNAVAGIFKWFYSESITDINHPFINSKNKATGFVAVTTDAGLLGGLNAQVIIRAMSLLEPEKGDKLIIVGKRGQLYLNDRKMAYANFPGITDEQRLNQSLTIRDYLVNNVLEGKFGKVKIVYPRAVSFTAQRIEVIQLIPAALEENIEEKADKSFLSEIIYESEPVQLIEYLIFLWIGQKIFEIFGLSRLAEQSARFMHLENCSERIKEMDLKLRHQYFRARHEIIDQNMRELYAARSLNEN